MGVYSAIFAVCLVALAAREAAAQSDSCNFCYLVFSNGAVNASVGCDNDGCGECTLSNTAACNGLERNNSGICYGTCSGRGPAAAPGEAPAPPPSNSQTQCAVAYDQSPTWSPSEGVAATAVNLYLSNPGATPINIPYTVEISAAGALKTVGSWNYAVDTVSDGRISGRVNGASWENLLPLQQNVVPIGFVLYLTAAEASQFEPSAISVNGATCAAAAKG